MSTTVSMGVWSVIVIGARSRILRSRRGGGPIQGEGTDEVNNTMLSPTIPSVVFLAWPVGKSGGRGETRVILQLHFWEIFKKDFNEAYMKMRIKMGVTRKIK